MSKKNKILIGVVAAIVLVMGISYVVMAFYYNRHFYTDTQINHIDCTGMTVEQVISRINENLDSYELELLERGDASEMIRGDALDLAFTDTDTIQKMMDDQDAKLWILDFFRKKNHQLQLNIELSEEKLSQQVDALQCMQEGNIVPPKDAYVTEVENGYGVAKEEEGNQPIRENILQVVKKAILAGETSVDLDASGCYVAPAVRQDDAALQSEANAMNTVISAKLTMDFGSQGSETLDAATLKGWIIFDENGTPVIDQGQVKAYVQSLADQYDTVGTARSFTTTSGQTISVSGGTFGWATDVETTTSNMIDAITSGTQGAFDITYSSTGKSRDGNDIGNTYVELSIQNQTFWVYVDGQMVLTTPVVTGTVSKGHDTPTGVYKIIGKTTDYIMKGDKNASGEWSYQVHCNYWIPFAANGTIGFHDLASRTEYGGEIYKTAGSLGCVNTPLDKVTQLYDLVSYNFPVVVY
ncbi:MAG: L,D-transpeptidase family protein [Lachnospiraceae bacterium]|nr:L,D-transpeptidase family protein [Lachnospiraceae bacterium]